MSYKLLHFQEISWCREIHVSLIQPSDVLLPISGMYRTREYSCDLLRQAFMKPFSDTLLSITNKMQRYIIFWLWTDMFNMEIIPSAAEHAEYIVYPIALQVKF
jgi:hypothetical protein